MLVLVQSLKSQVSLQQKEDQQIKLIPKSSSLPYIYWKDLIIPDLPTWRISTVFFEKH